MTTTTNTAATAAAVAAALHVVGLRCTGEGCGAQHAWPLHHIRHRGQCLHLCTSCVLRLHVGAFCSSCFELLSPESSDLVRCASCPAVAHGSCVASSSSAAAAFSCACCKSAAVGEAEGFSYFPVSVSPAEGSREIDVTLARALSAAARLASMSMVRAVAAARADVDRKAREATAARKRSREEFDQFYAVKDRDKERPNVISSLDLKKMTSLAVTALPNKKGHVGDREKWTKFNDAPQMQRPGVTGMGVGQGSDEVKKAVMAAAAAAIMQSNVAGPQIPKKPAEEIRMLPPGNNSKLDQTRGVPEASQGGPRTQQVTQGAL